MTEPPQDADRRPVPGPPQPYGQAARQYGQQDHGRAAQQYGQPQYGQGPGAPQDADRPYDQPPADPYGAPSAPGPTPQRRKRVGLIAGVTVVLAVLIAGAVVAALTLGPRILSREAVERDVAAQFEELHGVPIEIECPDDMVLESGAEYTCTGITDGGEEVDLAIAVTDPPGDAEYTWAEI